MGIIIPIKTSIKLKNPRRRLHKANTEEALILGSTVDMVSVCVEKSDPFKAHWTVFLVDIELLIIHLIQTQLSFCNFPCYTSLLTFIYALVAAV